MKELIPAFLALIACISNAAEFGFYHTFKAPNSSTVTMYKGAREIYVAKNPAIDSSSILGFSVAYSPLRINGHEWIHQITITFSAQGRELLNRMISEKSSLHLNEDNVALVLNGHIIFHGAVSISKIPYGQPDIIMMTTLSQNDYERLSQEQKAPLALLAPLSPSGSRTRKESP